jgi:hypothetical protein
MAAAIGAYLGACVDHRHLLSPGEVGYVLILSPTLDQSKIIFRYLKALIEDSPILRQLIKMSRPRKFNSGTKSLSAVTRRRSTPFVAARSSRPFATK